METSPPQLLRAGRGDAGKAHIFRDTISCTSAFQDKMGFKIIKKYCRISRTKSWHGENVHYSSKSNYGDDMSPF